MTSTAHAPTTAPIPAARVGNSLARFAGLDGLRGIAVALVLGYHLFPGLAPSGFVGVDVFFVISGFLITSLLLREREATGRIRLRRFWTRRARRLLPALVAVVTVCATAAAIIGGDVLARMGTQVASALTFSYNWVSVVVHGDYFAEQSPELFRNIWSLAVEEQFYLVWPLLLTLLLAVPWPRARIGILLTGAVVSAGWMAWLVLQDGLVTRAYYGTDSHAFGLLAGAALAFGLHRAHADARLEGAKPPLGAVSAVSSAIAAVVLLFLVASLPSSQGLGSFPLALIAATGASALLILVSVSRPDLVGWMLDTPPLRWLGQRSYGVYLWHWPVLVLLTAAFDLEDELPMMLGVVVLAITLVVSALSYRFLEQPVRRLGYRGVWRAVVRRLRGRTPQRVAAITGGVVALSLIAGTGIAVAAAPPQTSAEELIQAGQDLVGGQDDTPETVLPMPEERLDPATGFYEPDPVNGRRVNAIGDSVMLASAPELIDRIPRIKVDAVVSRQLASAPGMLQKLADKASLRDTIVVALGTNGPIQERDLDAVKRIIGPHRPLVLVTAFADRDWTSGVNKELRAYAAKTPNVFLFDWAAAIEHHTDTLAGDGIHPGPRGGTIYAKGLLATLERVQASRAATKSVAAFAAEAATFVETGATNIATLSARR